MNSKQLLEFMREDNRLSESLAARKQKDYTGGSLDAYKNFKIMEFIYEGLDYSKADLSELVMIWEIAKKVTRLASLSVQPPAVKNESKVDSYDDIKIYAQLAKGYILKGRQSKQQ